MGRLNKRSRNPGLLQSGNKSDLGSLLPPRTCEMLLRVCLMKMAVGSLLSPGGCWGLPFTLGVVQGNVVYPEIPGLMELVPGRSVTWGCKGFAASWAGSRNGRFSQWDG